MSLQSLIDFAEAENILNEKRIGQRVSVEEKAAKILAAMYLIQDKTDSIEPKLFLRSPNSLQHIINILKKNENGEPLLEAIESEIQNILRVNNHELEQIAKLVKKEEKLTEKSFQVGIQTLRESLELKDVRKELDLLSKFVDSRLLTRFDEFKETFESRILDLRTEIRENLKVIFEEVKKKFRDEIYTFEGEAGDKLKSIVDNLTTRLIPFIKVIIEKIEDLASKQGIRLKSKRVENEETSSDCATM